MSVEGTGRERPAAAKARAADGGPASKGRVDGTEVADLDLMTSEGCRRLVCAGFCTFFRQEPTVDDRCGGFEEVERLMAESTADPVVRDRFGRLLTDLLRGREPVSYAWDERLADLICRTCPFLSHGDCAHRDPDLDADDRLEPCGGYVLLAALADAGVIALRRP